MLDINEIGTVAERITQLVNHFCQGNKAAFGRAADIQSGVLAGIVGGRESKPGFEILQKLLTAYPTVSPDWLLFGRGPMQREQPAVTLTDKQWAEAQTTPADVPVSPTAEQWEEARSQALQLLLENDAIKEQAARILAKSEVVKQMWEDESLKELAVRMQSSAKAETEFKHTFYRVVGPPDPKRPYDGLLSVRLGISEDDAKELVRGKQIPYLLFHSTDRITNYRVMESDVQEYIAKLKAH